MFTEEIVSVRELVEFLLRSGDLDNRTGGGTFDMLEGSRIHRKIQDAAGEDYASEVWLSLEYPFPEQPKDPGAAEREETDGEEDPLRTITIEGRADGIFTRREEGGEPCICIDEIKTTARHLDRIREPEAVHLAQAKCYAYMHAAEQALPQIGVRMTYCSRITQNIRYFYYSYSFPELKQWFDGLMAEYRKWADVCRKWKKLRTATLRSLVFPYPYREGQKDLAAAVYRTIQRKKLLFLEAPTGTGKTVTTLFPAAKAMGEGLSDRIFYLTAKTVTRTAAEETVALFRKQGVRLKTCTLTAKEKICILDRPSCNPEDCFRASGHFDRINEALFDMLTHEDSFTRENIEAYAAKYLVCPFEMSLDLALFSDVIIGDYNYLFDPHARLQRFFADGTPASDAIFLIDEAHNLLDRGRAMYSADLTRSEILAFRRKIRKLYPALARKLLALSKEFLRIRRAQETAEEEPEPQPPKTGEMHWILDDIDRISERVRETTLEMEEILAKERDPDRRSQKDPNFAAKKTLRENFLDFYFRLTHFGMAAGLLDEHYITYAVPSGRDDLLLRLFNVDPSANLRRCMDRGRASILFSATFLPIQYYKELLGGTKEDYEIYAKSVFDARRQGLYVVRDVTSRYARRSEQQYDRIADCILKITGERNGNYMVFFPSYAFLDEIARRCEEKPGVLTDAEGDLPEGSTCIIRQRPGMDEKEREAFLQRFSRIYNDRSLIGLCILGGIFSEGIDLRSDSLIGAIVVGTGVPQVCTEREILKDYFTKRGEDGYGYAYRYPGMNKVLQAAGRVIRTQKDVGIVALLDDRFLTPAYRRLFPAEWRHWEETTTGEVPARVCRFWDEWL